MCVEVIVCYIIVVFLRHGVYAVLVHVLVMSAAGLLSRPLLQDQDQDFETTRDEDSSLRERTIHSPGQQSARNFHTTQLSQRPLETLVALSDVYQYCSASHKTRLAPMALGTMVG